VIEGILGRKMGMLQVFDKQGRMRGATVIEAGPCLITQVRTTERDGYQAVQLGFGSAKRSTKPIRGHLKNQGGLRYLREFRASDHAEHSVGERVGVEMFQEGDFVDVTATSKGRGFAGGVKRYGFSGGPKTHGQSDRHRAPGAIGAGNTPGRTFKGMRMAGHMGDAQVTVRNLEVIESDPARGLLLVAGAVPGARDGLVKVRFAKRTLAVARTRKPQPRQEEASKEQEQQVATNDEPAEEVAPVASQEVAPAVQAEPATNEEAPSLEAEEQPAADEGSSEDRQA
jgi:large subunit ribosomal protein L3